MRWRGRKQSTNVSDQRGQGGGGGFRLPGGLGGRRVRRPQGRTSRRAGGGFGLGNSSAHRDSALFFGYKSNDYSGTIGRWPWWRIGADLDA